MSNRPTAWMPIYWPDYLADTGHLSTEQHGAYLLLIAHYWASGKPLPKEDDALARITRCAPSRWQAIKSIILSFFQMTDIGWSHKRVEAELAAAALRYGKRSNAAAMRWSKQKQSTCNASPMHEQPQPHYKIPPLPPNEPERKNGGPARPPSVRLNADGGLSLGLKRVPTERPLSPAEFRERQAQVVAEFEAMEAQKS